MFLSWILYPLRKGFVLSACFSSELLQKGVSDSPNDDGAGFLFSGKVLQAIGNQRM